MVNEMQILDGHHRFHFIRIIWKETPTFAFKDSVLNSDDHFESHLPGNRLNQDPWVCPSKTKLRNLDICRTSAKRPAMALGLWHYIREFSTLYVTFQVLQKKQKNTYRACDKNLELSQNSRMWHRDILKCHQMSQNVTRFKILGINLCLPLNASEYT